jgi:hypothetical protein
MYFYEPLAIRSKDRHRHVNGSLIDNHAQELTRSKRDAIGVGLTSRQLAFDGHAGN